MFVPRPWAIFIAATLCFSRQPATDAAEPAIAPALPEITRTAPPPDFVDRAKLPKQWPQDLAGNESPSWRYWLIDTQIDQRTAQSTTFFDIAFEPVNAERLGDAGRFEISFRDEFQTLSLHQLALRRDGRWLDRFRPGAVRMTRRQSEFEADFSDNQVSALLVIDDVRVGDVVRIAYSVSGSNPVLAGQMHHEFTFASSFPILERSARVLFPAETAIEARQFNDPPEAQRRESTDGLEWRASATNVPARIEELDLPAWHIERPTWVVAQARDWSEVVDWGLPMYPRGAALPAELLTQLDSQRARPEAVRAAWALQMVQEDVRYFATILGDSSHRPTAPTLTWERRYGDCKDKAQLLSTLLRALDIDAAPALVSISDGRNLDRMPPSATAFDHVIVTAKIDGERLWLDPTMAWQRGPITQRRASVGGHALVLDAGQSQLMPLPEPEAVRSQVRVREHYQVPDPDTNAVSLSVETQRSGRAADQFRQTLASHSAEELQRGYTEYYRKHFGKVKMAQPMRVIDDPERNEIRITESYQLEDPWTMGELQSLITPTAAEVATQLAAPEQTDRVGPFVAAAPVDVDYEAHLTLPESWRSDASALDEKVQSPAFTWESRRKPGARELVLGHRFIGQRSVLTADQVDAHLSAVRRAEELARQGFRVIPPAQQRRSDRDARLRAILKSARERADGADDAK